MKLEIEITEAEIRSAIERKIRVAIAAESSGWSADKAVNETVREFWSEAMEKIVKEELAKSDQLRAKVQASIEAKLKAQITALMKVKA